MLEMFIVLFGLAIGSFLNVCIYRIPKEKSIVPSSRCRNCGYGLKWYDLIPVVSYLLLRGKCRKCGEKVSVQYPLIELLNGGIYLILFLKFGWSIYFFKYAFITSVFIVMSVIDFKTQYVYSVVSWTALAGAGIFLFAEGIIGINIWGNVIAAICGIAVFAGINLLSKIIYKKTGLGGGDVEVIIAMAITLGAWKFILAFFLAVVLGAVICIVLMIAKRIDRGDYVAFVPFLAGGTFIAMIFGDEIIRVYIEYLNGMI